MNHPSHMITLNAHLEAVCQVLTLCQQKNDVTAQRIYELRKLEIEQEILEIKIT